MERTLIILKPDAVQRQFCGRIISRFEDKGLKLCAMKMMHISRELAETHYAVHKGKPFYDKLISFITSSPVVVMALEGANIVEVTRKMMGATFGSKAEPATIRGDFGVSNSFNLIHGSDSPENAVKEIALFFSPEEMLDYELNDRNWIYDYSDGTPE